MKRDLILSTVNRERNENMCTERRAREESERERREIFSFPHFFFLLWYKRIGSIVEEHIVLFL
jgi:hypothetical protein